MKKTKINWGVHFHTRSDEKLPMPLRLFGGKSRFLMLWPKSSSSMLIVGKHLVSQKTLCITLTLITALNTNTQKLIHILWRGFLQLFQPESKKTHSLHQHPPRRAVCTVGWFPIHQCHMHYAVMCSVICVPTWSQDTRVWAPKRQHDNKNHQLLHNWRPLEKLTFYAHIVHYFTKTSNVT